MLSTELLVQFRGKTAPSMNTMSCLSSLLVPHPVNRGITDKTGQVPRTAFYTPFQSNLKHNLAQNNKDEFECRKEGCEGAGSTHDVEKSLKHPTYPAPQSINWQPKGMTMTRIVINKWQTCCISFDHQYSKDRCKQTDKSLICLGPRDTDLWGTYSLPGMGRHRTTSPT